MNQNNFTPSSIQKELRDLLWDPSDVQFPIVRRVWETNYDDTRHTFSLQFRELWNLYESSNRTFTFLCVAAMAYYKCKAPDNARVFNQLKIVGLEREIVERCGKLFVQYPRLAYLKTTVITKYTNIDRLMCFFAESSCEEYWSLWRGLDNMDPPNEDNLSDA